MKNFKIALPIFCSLMFAILFNSCKPDFKITSEYRDITVVYGLLNPEDNQHYIKIYKGYLTADNAMVWAQDLDNISYYDDIEVKLIESNNINGQVVTYPMDTVMSVYKNYGVFPSPTQVLYRPVKNLTSHKPAEIKENCTYQLVITNKKTGEVVTAQTSTIANMAFNIPMGTSQSVSTVNLNNDDPWTVGFKTSSWPENAYAVDAYLTFKYIEKNIQTGDTVHKAISDICMTSGFVQGNETAFKPSSVYRVIHDNLEPNDNVLRYPNTYACIDIKLWTCDEVYYTYYKTAQPSSSIVQDRIKYTNIVSENENALGFFASRTYYERHFKIDVVNHNEDSLVNGQWTKNLNFRPYTELLNN